jgi:hypothetical protein
VLVALDPSRSPHRAPAINAPDCVGQQRRWLPNPAANPSAAPPAVSQPELRLTVAPKGANPIDELPSKYQDTVPGGVTAELVPLAANT